MENLRRATIYASRDRDAATDLLRALLERTRVPAQSPRAAALAWFDAGYLVEAYRQQSETQKDDMLARFDEAAPGLRSELGALDGYVFLQKAIATTHEPEMEYAASLTTPRSGCGRAPSRDGGGRSSRRVAARDQPRELVATDAALR